MNVSIYGLTDPVTHELRYVGKTSQALNARLDSHVSDRRMKYRRSKWVAGLWSRGLRPDIFEIESVPECDWAKAEQFWISYFISIGCRLTNGTIGGEGVGGVRHTDETKAKISASKKGVSISFIDSAERSRKIGLAHKGKIMSAATRALLSKAHLGVRLTPIETQSKVIQLSAGGMKRIHIASEVGIHLQTVGSIIRQHKTNSQPNGESP